MSYADISDYALIGDCHGSALVSRSGSIDWACIARFDSGGVFNAILDATKGGRFTITARQHTSTSRRYLPDTNVLETVMVTSTGSVRIIDCFTMHEGGKQLPYRQLLRIVEGIDGAVDVDVSIVPRFDYASLRPWLAHVSPGVHSAVGGADSIVIQTELPMQLDRKGARFQETFRLGPGERRRFSVVACPPYSMETARLTPSELDARLEATTKWWRHWIARGQYDERHREAVKRSALVLKLLTCAPTGAIIAAPTTSLPESLGNTRNWDYRFSWIRDSAHVLAALLAIGHPEVAGGFKLFIERASAGRAEDLQVVYGCYGERRLSEIDLHHLEGYRQSRPVRAGNAAAEQVQLDVYGELLDAAHLWRRAGSPVTEDGWRFIRGLVEATCVKWKDPDRGIWEIRGEPTHFVQSKVMCWVALDRGIAAAEETGFGCDIERWRRVRSEIRETILREGVDKERGCFVQAFGSKRIDASLLLVPMVGFLPATDPRVVATVKAIMEDLHSDGFIQRYQTEGGHDGFHEGEGAFLMTSFWLVDVLAMQGKQKEAEDLFDRLLSIANDVGLYSEEYDPHAGQFLGNFPQAFSHMALINSASQLQRGRANLSCSRPIAERDNLHGSRCIDRQTMHHRAR